MSLKLSTTSVVVGEIRVTKGCKDRFESGSEIQNQAAALVGHRIYVFGGYAQDYLRGVYALDVNTLTWDRKDNDEKLQLSGNLNFLIRDTLYMIGGNVRSNPYETQMWTFDLSRAIIDPFYSRCEELIPPSGSVGEYLEMLEMIILYGGQTSQGGVSTLVGYSVISNTWQRIEVKGGVPPPRHNHSSCMHGTDEIFFFGGNFDGSLVPVNHLFHLRSIKGKFLWNEVNWQPLPVARANSIMWCIGKRVFIFGGYPTNGTATSDHLYIYDLEANAGVEFEGLRKTSDALPVVLVGRSNSRTLHSSVVSNGKIYVLGGYGAPSNNIYILSAA